jgi:hypothetical protein
MTRTSLSADPYCNHIQWQGPPSGPLVAGKHRMNNIIYIVGLVVIVLAVLSFFGFR